MVRFRKAKRQIYESDRKKGVFRCFTGPLSKGVESFRKWGLRIQISRSAFSPEGAAAGDPNRREGDWGRRIVERLGGKPRRFVSGSPGEHGVILRAFATCQRPLSSQVHWKGSSP